MAVRSSLPTLSAGVRLVQHLDLGSSSGLNAIAWHPHRETIATALFYEPARLWSTEDWNVRTTLPPASASAGTQLLAWSHDGQTLVVAGDQSKSVLLWPEGRTIRLDRPPSCCASNPAEAAIAFGSGRAVHVYDLTGRRVWDTPTEHPTSCLAFSKSGETLAFGTLGGNIRLVTAKGGRQVAAIPGHSDRVTGLAFINDDRTLISGSNDGTIRIWDLESFRQIRILEGAGRILSISASADGRYLAHCSSAPNSVSIWSLESWENLATLPAQYSTALWNSATAFHPERPWLACVGLSANHRLSEPVHLTVLALDTQALETAQPPVSRQRHYANAKVVLVGETGVGKSGLALALTGQPFVPTLSTHGRHVYTLDSVEEQRGGVPITRETLLWDLAGQPGYRVFHRHHLHDASVAVVVFDARSESDPFAGVAFWARAFDEAAGGKMPKLLVAGRIDRTAPAVSDARVREFCERFGFDAYIQTSAMRGDGIDELLSAIRGAIPWSNLPIISAPDVFAALKKFLLDEKMAGYVLASKQEILTRYRASRGEEKADGQLLEACLGRLETAGLIRAMSFGGLVLLQPELLDTYSAWLAQAARAEPDGMGAVLESKARRGAFPMDADRPLAGRTDEALVLVATIEELLYRNIALRQPTHDGEMLVFPSELREDLPDIPHRFPAVLTIDFQGPVRAVAATLAVSLAHTPAFGQERFYRNGATYLSKTGHICGFRLMYADPNDDTGGRLTLFFQAEVDRPTRLTFVGFAQRHVASMAFDHAVVVRQVVVCKCGYTIPDQLIDMVLEHRLPDVTCGFCKRTWPVEDLVVESMRYDREIREQQELADEERECQARLAVVEEREARQEPHVFLCHNNADKPHVRALATELRRRGVYAWIDESNIPLGRRFSPELEKIVSSVPAAAVLVGPNDLGPWQRHEVDALLSRATEAGFVLLPTLLPEGPEFSGLPPFLRNFTGLDARGGWTAEIISQFVHAVLPNRGRAGPR